MQTLQPTLRLGRDVWDRAAMPIAEFNARADRVRAAMDGAGLDAMLLYGRGLNDCGHPTYLANYIVKLPFAALVVLPRDGDPALIFEGATRGRDAAKATTWIDDVRPCWNVAETCLSVLEERGLSTKRIGLAGMPRLVPFAEWRRLRAGLGHATVVDAEPIVDRLRAVKSPREIAQMQRASQVASLAIGRVSTIRVETTTESDVAAEVIRSARSAGAEDIRLVIARPREFDWAFRPPEEVRLTDRDAFVLHVAVSWERYWWEATRTFIVRGRGIEPVWSNDIDRRFHTLAAAFRPHALVRDAARDIRQMLTTEEWQAIQVCGLGHGVGITPEEWPLLSDNSDDRLEPGMCIVVRAAMRGVDTAVDLVVRSETIVL